MKIIALLLAILLAFSACSSRENTVSSSSGESSAPPVSGDEASSDALEADEERWVKTQAEMSPPLTRVEIDDSGLDYAVVETVLTDLFTLPDADYDFALFYLLDENLGVFTQQQDVTVYDLSGKELSRIPCVGTTALFCGGYFLIENHENKTAGIYDKNGKELITFSTSEVMGYIQSFAVTNDAKSGVFVASDYMNPMLHTLDLTTGEIGVLDTSDLPEGATIGYELYYTASDTICAFSMSTIEDKNGIAYYDIKAGKLAEFVEVGYGVWDRDIYIRPAISTSKSGLIYTTTDTSRHKVYNFEYTPSYGDELNTLNNLCPTGGALWQLYPVTKEGRVGYFPLYWPELVGMESEDSGIIRYFDSGRYKISRLTLTDKITQPPKAGDYMSQASLDAVCGQRLTRSDINESTYGLLNAMVWTYVDTFAYGGYELTPDMPELADRLIYYTYFHTYGSNIEWRKSYWNEAQSAYEFPLADMKKRIDEIFSTDGLEYNLTISKHYDEVADALLIMGGGIGASDVVYVDSARYEDGKLKLDVTVLPKTERAGLDTPPKEENISMVISYSGQGDKWRYDEVKLK